MTDTTLTQRDHDTTFRLQDQYLRGDVAGTVRTSRLFRTRYPRAATTTRLGPERSSTIATNLAPVLQHAQPPAVLPQANESCWCGSGRKYKRCHKPLEGRVLPGIVSPTLEVPAHIARPPYADTGRVERWAESRVKSPEIIERMRHAGAMAAEVLRLAGEMVAPGVTTDEIDRYVHQLTIDRGAYPSPLHYNGFPKSVCTSVNEVICHGIPDSRALVDGDIVNLDVTVYVDGVHGDTNATFFVGDVDPASRHLVQVTEECTWYGIEAVVPGRPLSDIGRAIESHAKKHRYGVVKAFIGHGIGEQFHTDVQVLHYYDPRANMIMRPGMTFTIEPMISMGTWQHKMAFDDGWTAVTADGKRTAQFEHTCLVTDDGVEVLTAPGAVSPCAPWRR
ncbi:MAG: type I methionyl aminopeptidase [Acidimicrobiales bacterium]|nr:type I methionyl aminopeptidase [Acidimicrobiales bacterium]MCB9392602.1 type I methionyl aminopeptidase [Acidimicrobiaceae bacterium]